MPSLVWSDALDLAMPAMDNTHREFVERLAAVQAADDGTLVAAWQALLEHTEEHFGREDEWMIVTGFAPNNCHSTQHAVVLNVMREGARRGAQGDPEGLAAIGQMAKELASWFAHHAQTMDAGLALHLKTLGYDPDSGALTHPAALPAQAIKGCGAPGCDHPLKRRAQARSDASLETVTA